jgi:hypothetical protein
MNKRTLPSTYQYTDEVLFCCMPDDPKLERSEGIPARILAIHFYPGKEKDWEKYDLELRFVGGIKSRVYNIDTILLQPHGKTLERLNLIRERKIEPDFDPYFVKDSSEEFRTYLAGRRITYESFDDGTKITEPVDLFELGRAYDTYLINNKSDE